MRNMIAFCGLDCAACPAYIATQANDEEGRNRIAENWSKELGLKVSPDDCICDGCQPFEGGRLGGYCSECPMRACNIEHAYEHCGQCPAYMCDDLSKFVGGSKEAKDRLEALRKSSGT